MITPQDDIQEIKKSMINLVDKMSAILQNSPKEIEEVARHLSEFNRLAVAVAMGSYVSKADKKFLENVTHTLDKEIQPLLQENMTLKQAQKHQSSFLRELQNVKEGLKQENSAPSTPRMGGKN